MILPFSTKWPKHMGELAGKPNYFVCQILEGMMNYGLLSTYGGMRWMQEYLDRSPENIGIHPTRNTKIHTIRFDPMDRWEPEKGIDFFIASRTKEMYRFAPRVQVVSVQKITMLSIPIGMDDEENITDFGLFLSIDGRIIEQEEACKVALNDGFNSVEDFHNYFFPPFTRARKIEMKLIHWTSFKY